jgi:hypothetical protein
VTDSEGRYALEDLDPELLFRLLAVAECHVPALSPKPVDPNAGPADFKLTPHDLDKRDPALVLRGRVLDESGEPVPAAVVEPFGFSKGNTTQYGGLRDFDPLGVTNSKGEFRLRVPEPGLGLYVRVSAPLFAPRSFAGLPTGPNSNELRLCAGVTVTGRLLKEGKPLVGVGVGVCQKDRGAATFVGEFQSATDDKGVFRITNVPPDEVYLLYGKMETLKTYGALGVREVKTDKSGSSTKLGDLAVEKGLTLRGQLVLADGKPVPKGTRVMLYREEAWDDQQTVAAEDGSFVFEGLPPERYGLSSRVPGYHVSPKNASYELLNGGGLTGMVRSDMTGLRLLLEPGPEPERPQFNNEVSAEHQRRQQAPLRGAPEVNDKK